MSKLLGIVNPHKPASDPYDYWLWRAGENPHPIRCAYEELAIEKTMFEGNILFRILGRATPLTPDGVYLRMAFNADHDPTVLTDPPLASQPELNARPNGHDAAPLTLTPVGPVASEGVVLTSAAGAPSAQPGYSERPTVASPQPMEGETKAQWMRRKASALRWQANQIEAAATQIEALEAQGLI